MVRQAGKEPVQKTQRARWGMVWTLFITNSMLLGAALAMDAFSVSVGNGLSEPDMPAKKMALIAGTFGFFQFLMPMLGWLGVHLVIEAFQAVQKAIPWIAVALLGFLGVKMIVEALRRQDDEGAFQQRLGLPALLMQGIATSIDALSTGFAIAGYGPGMAFAASAIIAAVTFAICLAGLKIGKFYGLMLARKASVLGGLILIFIGIEIFFSSAP